MKTIKGGTIVSNGRSYQADIKVQDEFIVEIGDNLTIEGECINAEGCYVFPGFIDPHTHFQLDNGCVVSPDDFEAGTRSALAGGTTTILDFATAFHGESLEEGLDNWFLMADGHSSCNYGFHMAFTQWNQKLKEEIPVMAKRGVTSFKVYMAYDSLMTNNEEIYEILKEVDKIGGIVGCHCEIGSSVNQGILDQIQKGNLKPDAHPLSRPDVVEAEAVKEYLEIAKRADCVVNIVHLSTAMGLEVIRLARKNGQKVYVETCPHYLVLEDDRYNLPDFQGAKFTMSPPLRKKKDVDGLWEAIHNNEIDTLATDHCSFDFEGQKTLGMDNFSKIPNGIPGVENRPELIFTYGVLTGKMTVEQMSAMCSENAAKQFGMYPQKGNIGVGSDADLVIWDPSVTHVISQTNQHNNSDYTPYEGIEVKGQAKHVLLGGKHVIDNGVIVMEQQGKYVSRHEVTK